MIEAGGALETAVYGGSMGVGLGTTFLFIRWLASFVAGRVDAREAQVDAGMRELLEGLKEQVTVLGAECKELRQRVAATENDLLDCKRRHAESEAEVMRLKALIQARGEIRDRAQVVIAADKLSQQQKRKANPEGGTQ